MEKPDFPVPSGRYVVTGEHDNDNRFNGKEKFDKGIHFQVGVRPRQF